MKQQAVAEEEHGLLSITPPSSSADMKCLVRKADVSTHPPSTAEVSGEHREEATIREKG